jgi:hypothetical protein
MLFTVTPRPPPSKGGLKLVCNLNIVYGNLKSENSQDYAQKLELYCHEFGFWADDHQAATTSSYQLYVTYKHLLYCVQRAYPERKEAYA